MENFSDSYQGETNAELSNENIDEYNFSLESLTQATKTQIGDLDQEIFADQALSIQEVQTILDNMAVTDKMPLPGIGHLLSIEIGLEFIDKFIPNLSCNPGSITGSLSGVGVATAFQNFAEWYNREYAKLDKI